MITPPRPSNLAGFFMDASTDVTFYVLNWHLWNLKFTAHSLTQALHQKKNAKAAVESINREMDKRFALHSSQLATHGNVEAVRKEVAELAFATKKDIAELKAELIKAIAESQRWTITAIFAAVGIFAALTKVLH